MTEHYTLENFIKQEVKISGWSGAQYSVLRFFLGLFVFIDGLILLHNPVVGGFEMDPTLYLLVPFTLMASVAFSLGYKDKLAALFLFLFCVGDMLKFISPVTLFHWTSYLWILFFYHLFVPKEPYGSWDARGRLDPISSWGLPKRPHDALWIGVSLGSILWQIGHLITGVDLASLIMLSLAIVMLISCYFTTLRFFIWMGIALLLFAPSSLSAFPAGTLFLILALCDPSWFDERDLDCRQERIYYDGSCALCHFAMRFVLAEDMKCHFRFSPLYGPTYKKQIGPVSEAPDLDTIEVVTCEEKRLQRSEAVLRILYQLGGLWRFLSLILNFVPTKTLDKLYNLIAKYRYRFFGRKEDSCPRIPLELQARFDL